MSDEPPKKKMFAAATEAENAIFSAEAARIYKELREKYPEKHDHDLDVILNSLCGALVLLVENCVLKDDQMAMLQLIYRIIFNNLKNEDWRR